jgi:hypothetical protein
MPRVLLFDEWESGAGARRAQADACSSSHAVAPDLAADASARV